MSTATIERPASLTDLDYTPPCDCDCHSFLGLEQPPAVYLISVPDDEEMFACTPCMEVAKAFFGDALRVFPLKK